MIHLIIYRNYDKIVMVDVIVIGNTNNDSSYYIIVLLQLSGNASLLSSSWHRALFLSSLLIKCSRWW